jgi:hypothetical protein
VAECEDEGEGAERIEKKSEGKTGVGPCETPNLFEAEEKIIAFMGETPSFSGMPVEIESGAVLIDPSLLELDQRFQLKLTQPHATVVILLTYDQSIAPS